MSLTVDHLLRTAATLALAPRHLEQLRAVLQRVVPTAEVWAYGSRLTGQHHEGSDLDLVLRHADDPSRPMSELFELIEALQDSALPMLVEVHDWARLPAAFHAAIEGQHVVIQPGQGTTQAHAQSVSAA